MDAMAYHLQARAPFHFGTRGVGIEATAVHGPSDTLFSALCYVLRAQFGLAALQDFLAGYTAPDPPLVLSSAFPYLLSREEEEVEGWVPPDPFDPDRAIRFYPRPLEPPPGVPDEPKERKRVKKIAWVSEGVFRAWVGGDSLDRHYDPEHLVQHGRVWLTAAERARLAGWRDEETDAIRLWAVGDVPRVTVDRRASASTVYQAGRVWFQAGGGLWLLARWREDWQERGELALRVLGDAGVGGERSAGHGQFWPHGPHTLRGLPDPTPGGRFTTLSLYYPQPDELAGALQGDGVSYRLRMRRGWMASPDRTEGGADEPFRGSALRRKAVRMFAEGSILRWPGEKTALGGLADVTPDVFKAVHLVYRYGYAYAVGYRPEGGVS
jgi:CRISPR-associated protein Csm4